ncbi:OLC1v1023146C2 [Oldenlandia corymbosa var. corymbosa]|nr:OLC1v1023146C2 [Oldenlandia corymbosa var. corymbosa]
MRFPSSLESAVSERDKDKVLKNSRSKKKHKRLDAICENVYTRNHNNAVEKEEMSVANVEENENDRRRSTRVRRAPEVLDASPLPPKKRRKMDKRRGLSGVAKGKRVTGVKSEDLCSISEGREESLSRWRSRLRTKVKGKHARFGGGAKGTYSPSSKKKLFEGTHELKEETVMEIRQSDNEDECVGGTSSDGKSKMLGEEKVAFRIQRSGNEEESVGRRSSAAKSKKLGSAKVLSSLEKENKETDLPDAPREEEVDEDFDLGSSEGNALVLKGGTDCVNDDAKDDFGTSEVVEKEETETQGCSPSDEYPCNEDSEMLLDKQTSGTVERPIDTVEVDGAIEDSAKVGEHPVGAAEGNDVAEDQSKVDELPNGAPQGVSIEKLDRKPDATYRTHRPIRIKEGRRCGLCGGGTDGKPPKKLVHYGCGSDDEACSGDSASDEPNYDVWDGFGDEPNWLGRLLGPVNDRFGIAGIWVHQQCAVWSPEVYFAGLGCLKNVRAALYRGRVLKCSRCGRPGATIGCRVDRCPKTYHLPCARDTGSIFDHRKFLIACADHRHIFQPEGSQYLHRLKKMKLKKMKLEIRKVSNDALRKDVEAEEKWLEHCGEDEEFLKRESKRLHRDLLRIAPTYIGGSGSDSSTEMQFQGWESVAGLQDVIQCMKEVVILPLLYPEFFSNLGITPPRGVLLHGYPGTGKTLVVRALIGSCAHGDRRIAYFARKGADCLGKYVGDAERQLRLLFQVAEKSQPSIIFFDEIDGLAPSRSRQQDQTHSSVVSTLLALMDGLKSRGSVVVIGATNRPDAIDPALRRPGRFDREIYFPLPSVKDREAILSLHTRKWPKQISGSVLKWVARRTVGFAGADLQALCTQAAIIALRRNFPLQELLAGAGGDALLCKRPPLPSFTVEEKDWLDALSLAPPPCSLREAGNAANDVISSPLPVHLVPCLLPPLSKLIVSLYLEERIWLPPPLHKVATLIKNVIVSALVERAVVDDKWWSHLPDLLREDDILKKIEDKLSRTTILTDAFGSFDPMEDVGDDRCSSFKPSRLQRVGVLSGISNSISLESGVKSGYRILVSGEARSGQRHLSSCLLHCFSGNIEIRKLDLATLFQEGRGDVLQGLTAILMRSVSVGSCLIFLPRIDLWALETCSQPCEESQCSPSNTATEEFSQSSESQAAEKIVTYLWNSFVEQVESISVQTPLMIMATTEVPLLDLPLGIKQFFGCEILKCGLLNPSKDTVPRFPVEIDGHLNHVSVTDTSAERLLLDLVQYYIHFLRLEIHSNSLCDKKSSDFVELSADAIISSSDPGSTTEGGTAPVTSVPVHNPVKGKSSLLAAISTFGYQILKYPHFAELCWVTSKLKEGPCSRIDGPWKGWPFNSCIVRPLNSKEGFAVTSTSSATKNMDKSSVARGLIAVGLSAYRGEYTSLRAFTLDIRKVLEILVGCIDAKIQTGKDKYKFFRLLSQVAYFEDIVISWAYSLRSLEVDAPCSSPGLTRTGSLTNPNSFKQSLCDGGKGKSSDEILHEPEKQEQISREVSVKDTVDHQVAGYDTNHQNKSEELGSVHKQAPVLRVSDNSASTSEIRNPLSNGMISEACMPVDTGNDTEIGSGSEGCERANGFLRQDSSAFEDGALVSGNKFGMELNKEDAAVALASNGTAMDNGTRSSLESCLKSSSRLPMSCMYLCCSRCLVNLYNLLLKLINNEWKVKGSSEAVEDFHDVVSSLSISLQSAVRKMFAKNCVSSESDEKLMQEKCCNNHQCTQMCISQCKISERGPVVPMECSSHSTGEDGAAEGKVFPNPRFDFNTKFFFRDGVLVSGLDTGGKDSLHCKFEKLCLCSLVECIESS